MTSPPRRPRWRVAMLVSAAIAIAGCGGVASDQVASTTTPSVSATTTPPAPVVQAISGNQVDFGDALAEDTVLWFWAPW